MNQPEVISKIQKLLRLAQSPSEEEAQNALLHARKLMAKYFLTDADINSNPATKEVRYEKIGVTYTARSTAWKQTLASVITENYRCMMFASHCYGKQTYELGIAGLGDDFEICKQAILYAIDCVESAIVRKIRNDPRFAKISKRTITGLENNYAHGFAEGLYHAFKEQNQTSEELGLMMVVPSEVQHHVNERAKGTLAPRKPNADCALAENARNEGYRDGWKYGTVKRVQGERKEPIGLCEG